MKICPVCGLRVEDEARFCPRDGAVLEQQVTDPFLGKVLLGQFEVEEVIGQGTTGSVYRARQLRMDRPVAIKVLRPELAREAVVVERFHREAKAVAKLSHPNIITVHLVAETEQGIPYMVMEYVEGEDLQTILTRQAPLPTPQIVELGSQISAALAEAHGQGIVHRDLKPANIKLTERAGRTIIKVLDFGIAKILQEDSQGKLTKTGTVFGTPHYVSPEQASGAKVDHRTDIYSLGVILFQMATGRLPFESTSGLEVLVKHIKEPPPRPSEVVGTMHPELERLILQALSKDPTERQASAEILARDLKSLVRSQKSPDRSSKSVQTLDMTGWSRKSSQSAKATPESGIPKTGTKLAFGGTGAKGPSVAEQVAERARSSAPKQKDAQSGRQAAAPVPDLHEPSSSTGDRPTQPAHPPTPPDRWEAPGPGNSGVVLEPATDYASGRATSMDIRRASQIAPAPAPVTSFPKEPDTLVDNGPPSPDPDTMQPEPPSSRPGNIPAPDAGSEPIEQHPMASGPDWMDPEPQAVQAPSDWSMSDMKRYQAGPGKGLWVALTIALILGAGAAGAFVWYRHRQSSQEGSRPSTHSQTPSGPTGADAGTRTGRALDAESRPGGNTAGRKKPGKTLVQGTRLSVGARNARVTIENTTLTLGLSRTARVGRTSKIVLTVRGEFHALLGANLVTPDGALAAVKLTKENKRYRGAIQWHVAGLHRLVVRYNTMGHKAMAWFSVPVLGTRSHRSSSSHHRMRPAPSRETANPFSDTPDHAGPQEPLPRREARTTAPDEEDLPVAPDEPPTTPPPTRPRPEPSDDLPPPPDDGS